MFEVLKRIMHQGNIGYASLEHNIIGQEVIERMVPTEEWSKGKYGMTTRMEENFQEVRVELWICYIQV